MQERADKEQIEACDHVARREAAQKQLSEICKTYKMPDYVNKTIKPKEKDIVIAFAGGVPDCFAQFKKTGSLNRVYVKYNLKEGKQSRAKSTMEKIKK